MNDKEHEILSNEFSKFVSELLMMPIWIKQLIYVYLRYRLEEELTSQYLNSYDIEDIFQLHKSVLTYKGKKELETRNCNFSENHYNFLQKSLHGFTITEITIENNWTLFEISNIFIDCLEKELIAMPSSVKMIEIVRYMSGRTRIGEYFLRTGQLTNEQLEIVLTQQEKIKKATNEQVGIATVLVNMGYISESEVKAVLRYKEESRKRFSLKQLSTAGCSSNNITNASDITAIQTTNERLLKENKILKLQLRKLLNLSE